VLERLLLRLDEQGLALSSPWPQRTDSLIVEAVWPKVWAIWTEKQKWAGCRELGEELSEQWHCVKVGQTLSLCVQKAWEGSDLDSAAAAECLWSMATPR